MNRKAELQKSTQVREKLTYFFNTMVKIFGNDETIYELMTEEKRGYVDINMFHTLKEIGVFRCDSLANIAVFLPDITEEDLLDFGIVNTKGRYLMQGRYVLPIRDITGTVISLVGWLPQGGTRKYLTATTYGFSRSVSFFNYDSFHLAHQKFGGVTFEVEGIFGAVALRSLGLPCIANMGLEMSYLKEIMLSRYTKVITIGDNDNGGKSINPLLATSTSKKSKIRAWKPKTDTVYVSLPDLVEDPDDFVKYYDCKDDLLECMTKAIYHKLEIDKD